MPNYTGDEYIKYSEAVLPYGSSTCSKAPSVRPFEPAAIRSGKGCRIYDIEGREFIDFRNSLGPITLGYQFPDTNEAIIEQLNKGIVFGNPADIEGEVAHMLSEVIPSAEKVRFLKTGGEAVAACIRMARAYTGKNHIIQIGYNGWLNSLSPDGPVLPRMQNTSTRNGVPYPLASLHHSCGFNNLPRIKEIVEETNNEVAAVVVAADYATMAEGKTFYPALREYCDQKGILLVYDEIVTGFRIAIGGIQEYFGVKPDLSVFAKGIANGMPLSAYVGRKEVMDKCDRGGGVSISSTLGGEALSLAACKASILAYKKYNVIDHLWNQGNKLWDAVNGLLEKYNLPLRMEGFAPCKTFIAQKSEIENPIGKFFACAFKNGVSLYNTSYVNYSHKDADVAETIERLEKACIDFNNKAYKA